MPQRPIILILGPTAGGKTALALDLARALPGGGECVCADSMQIYRGMDIGTAKPTLAEQAKIPHHLLDRLDPWQDGYSVDRWLHEAEEAVAAIRGHGRWPIVVGGTSLYIQTLLHGLFEGPEPDPKFRETLAALGDEALRRRLVDADPEAAQRIHANDRRRTIRALEVFAQSGRPISDLQQQWNAGIERGDVRVIGLDYDRQAINPRINARVKAMMSAGLLDEVSRLWRAEALGRQAREALGYKQLIEHLEGRATLDDAVEQTKIATRRMAKGQRSWLRRFRSHARSRWFSAGCISIQTLANQSLLWILGDADAPARPNDFSREPFED